jgi:CDP-2,3-bis-(O-geranylgeranyl)-sn-glycerol synthase
MLELKLLLLIMAANSAPVLASDILRQRFVAPVDLGRKLFDGRPLFGASKTWRGVVSACLLTPLAAWILGIGVHAGLLIALGAMAGDLVSSFTKRRLNRPVSSKAIGLDQIPEALLPLLAVQQQFALGWGQIALLVAAFLVIELSVSPLLYRLKLRKRPY